jgi:hypothetical protein
MAYGWRKIFIGGREKKYDKPFFCGSFTAPLLPPSLSFLPPSNLMYILKKSFPPKIG